ncbi:MAG: hypothetical protein [Wendovervirus sonii]|uniref:Uncharacterized protein n=1 Tax=phage Lak_Megaphage_Sonny TaxID=3109229 RepID=A0ABZ0Z448_9CAUD|nr:MAG: hypothetical protein [phage Lak_Megaphage_Sonny]
MEYKYQKEFPRPFENAVIDIVSQESKALDWKNPLLHKDFKNAIVNKLNDNSVNFNGKFFIGSSDDADLCIKSFDDHVFNHRATGISCFLYFVDDSMNVHKIAMVRGWGHLTGTGALNLNSDKAAEIQDDFLNWVCDQLNESNDTDIIVKYEVVSIDDKRNNLDAQFDEYFNNKTSEPSVQSSITIDDNSKYLNNCSGDNYFIDDTQSQCWYSATNTKPYAADPKIIAKKKQTPWYAQFLNKKHKKR